MKDAKTVNIVERHAENVYSHGRVNLTAQAVDKIEALLDEGLKPILTPIFTRQRGTGKSEVCGFLFGCLPCEAKSEPPSGMTLTIPSNITREMILEAGMDIGKTVIKSTIEDELHKQRMKNEEDASNH